MKSCLILETNPLEKKYNFKGKLLPPITVLPVRELIDFLIVLHLIGVNPGSTLLVSLVEDFPPLMDEN